MANAPIKKPATYEDVERAPEGMIAEIIDGEMSLRTRGNHGHQRFIGDLVAELGSKFDGRNRALSGWYFLFGIELHLFKKKEPIVPDVVAWCRERMPEEGDDAPWISLRPDWVCEVLSPSTARWDRGKKLPAYARAGVPHAWLVDVPTKLIEVYRLDGKTYRYIGAIDGESKAKVEPFDDVELDLNLLWAR